MHLISDHDQAVAVLNDPNFVVPAVPPATEGVAWLRASVGRFSSGPAHQRRRALAEAILDAVPPQSLRAPTARHPVAVLARAIGVPENVVEPVEAVAQAYQPGTGDDARADVAVDQLVRAFGGAYDEATAARIGVLVQACAATTVLIERARQHPVEVVLRDHPPVPMTRRQALVTTTVGDVTVTAGDVVQVGLSGGLAFGTGPRRCPGQHHALALVDGALGNSLGTDGALR